MVVLPQLLLYRLAAGHWIVNAYADRGFTFASPHVFGVLFSAQKGLFFYAPVLLVGVAGLVLYWHGVLPASDLTWQGYRDVFLKTW